MSIITHLAEFRRRLIACLVVFAVTFCVSFYYAEWIVDHLRALGENFSFIYISPTELMLSYIRIAVIAGIVISFPVIGYNLWRFLCPGLTVKEKMGFFAILTFGVVLFVAGASFCYAIVMPLALKFLGGINMDGSIMPMVSIQNYLSFVLSMLITFGIVFELPIVTILLTKIGLLNPLFLKKNRKYVFLLTFVVAAIITPPDITTQILVALPMMVLFEISIALCSILFRKRLKNMSS
ncbi:twin-arginine translocase subunit TatC [Fusibacter paucivorans]|uniref:Sec-independent protein translocase protein TatC n=1 Tax=Fusibacter paucivorans TaxID=76009 RepID=A0ABS5PNC8_9FIRM|nr:twin-arginine translocase subunit TatC [Fusibacter paucivorans]MBS7526387.1 twin-arginine translocase subunit TatC [Fusibacter paucivorans]